MKPEQQAQQHREHVVLGMAAGMGAYFMFSVMVLFAKLLSVNHSVIEIAFYRNLVGSSLFIPVLGVIFLKESVGPYRWSAVVAGFLGVIIMARPSGEVYTFGIAVALTAALLHATLQIILRYLGRYESPETISFYFFVIGTLLTAVAMPFVAVTPTLRDLPLLLGVGLSGTTAQWLLSNAYRNAPAAIVTVFNYTSIVWASLFGWIIWNEWPLPAVLIGASIVIASNILLIWRESRRSGQM